MAEKKCKDHLGNEYRSMKEMCKAYSINESTYIARINAGWSLKDALTQPRRNTSGKACTDHLGNTYRSVEEMCRAYNIARVTYDKRIEAGLSVEDALTSDKVLKTKECTDHLGNKYNSIDEMCKAYNISTERYSARVRLGWSIKDALTLEKQKKNYKRKKYIDHKGKTYNSTNDMCEAYGISLSVYYDRLKRGYSLEDVLTKPKYDRWVCKDHLGNGYRSIVEMCKAYGVSRSSYLWRVKNGWSIERALTKH